MIRALQQVGVICGPALAVGLMLLACCWLLGRRP